MKYNNLRNKLNKFKEEIPKYQTPAGPLTINNKKRLQEMNSLMMQRGLSLEQSQKLYDSYNGDLQQINTMLDDGLSPEELLNTGPALDQNGNEVTVNPNEEKNNKFQSNLKSGLTSVGKSISGVNFSKNASWRDTGLSEKGAMGMGIAAQVGIGAMNAADQALMGDKNFSAQSQAIDSAVHGVSGTLMASGNPWAMGAGALLEGINFITKIGGKTVSGFDINGVDNSGYSQDMFHQKSESGRFWEKMGSKLAKRNEKARLALSALNVSSEQKFEQEARMNSVDNVLRTNQIALAGGIDINSLGA